MNNKSVLLISLKYTNLITELHNYFKDLDKLNKIIKISENKAIKEYKKNKCKHDYCDRESKEDGYCEFCIQLNTERCNFCGSRE